MNDELHDQSAQAEEELDEGSLRRRLIGRIVLAGVAIVILLGALVVVDKVYVSPKKPVAKIVAAPAVTAASQTGEQIALSAVAASAPEPPKPEAVPTIQNTTISEESDSPSVVLPKPSKAAVKPAPTVKQAQTPPARPQAVAAKPASLARPLTQGAKSERNFVLQMGVFNNVDNAQELLARLQKGGVPAQIEARVQVGPFKTRKEADDARAKLTAMGLDAGLLMAIHR